MYIDLIKYFLNNNLYKSTNTNDAYIFKVVIANDFSEDQIISKTIIEHILFSNKNNTSSKNNSINSSRLSIVDTITYINLLSEYVISNIFLHNNKNAFKKFVIDNTLLNTIKNNTKNNTDNYKSYSKALYLIYIKILTEGLYYENKFFLNYFKDTNQDSIFNKHYQNFINLYNEGTMNKKDKYDLSLVFSKISKRFIIILFNFIKHNQNINIDKDDLLQYKFNSEPILLKFDYFTNETLKKIKTFDNKEKENFFKFVMNILNKESLECKLNKKNISLSPKLFNFIIQMLKLYKNLEHKFITKNKNTNQYKFVWTENTSIQQSQKDFDKIDYINSIIIKLNKSIKSILSKSLKKEGHITAEKNNNNNINYFSTYVNTVILDNNDTNIYSYNISTGIEINAGGPTKAFFTDLSKELSKYINNLRRLKEDFPYIKNTNLSRNSNRNNNKFNNSLTDPKISSSNIYYLGKMIARLLFIEKYDTNLTFPNELYNGLIILLNNPKLILDNYKIIQDKVIKNNNNVTQEVIKNIDDYLLLDKDEIFRILNSSNDDFIMEFSYSGIEGNNITGFTNSNGNVNSDKVKEFIQNSEKNKSELKQKLINFYEESKFIEDMYVILNNSNYRKFFKGFLEIYVKVLSKNKNFLINDLIYLTDKNTLKKSIENTVITTADFINKLIFNYGNIPGTTNNNNPYNKKDISENKDAVQNAFIEGIKAIAEHYENNTKNSSSSNNNAKKKLTKQDFFEDLLYFWTGSRVLPKDNKDKLKIDFYMNKEKFNLLNRINNSRNNSKNTSRNNSNNNINTFIKTNKYELIPKSHTCFNSIDMVAPINADGNYLEKYQKIITKLFKFGFEEGIFGAASFGAA